MHIINNYQYKILIVRNIIKLIKIYVRFFEIAILQNGYIFRKTC